MKIVLGQKYESYENACLLLDLETLEVRRDTLCLNFALKCLKNDNHAKMFIKNTPNDHNVRNPETFFEPTCSTKRYQDTPIPYLTRILNQYFLNN